MINKKYHCEIEVISPVHVGVGKEKNLIKGIDFIYNRNTHEVLVIDQRKLIDFMGIEKFSGMLIAMDSNALKTNVEAAKAAGIETVTDRYILDTEPEDEIKVHMKNALTNKPVVPGSSIKGALRSVLFKHLKAPASRSNDEVFGSLRRHNDFMRFIKISDAQFENTELYSSKIYNLKNEGANWTAAWKNARQGNNSEVFKKAGFTSVYEVIPPLEKASFSIMLSDLPFNVSLKGGLLKDDPAGNLKQKSELINGDIKNLFDIVNRHTISYLANEVEFFEQYDQAEHSNLIIEYLEYLVSLIDADNNSCLLRMASGSGFHSVTGDWQCKDHVYTIERPLNGKRYKSRRMAFAVYEDGLDFNPMGFVQISCKT
jgi:hypothetical protein